MKREMHYQTVDLSGVCDRKSLHDRLRDSLTLPAWYGRNLDALYDVLTDSSSPIYVCFTAWEELEKTDPSYFRKFRSVLQAVEAELPGSSFLFAEAAETDEEEADDSVPGGEEDSGTTFFRT